MHKTRSIAVGRGIQTLLRAIYPAECLGCRSMLAGDSGLCGPCWRDTPFIQGAVCEDCGTPLIGEVETGDLCDDCMVTTRPWTRGRAALMYEGRARQLVLALKHGDRQDIVRPAAKWMAKACGQVVEGTVVVPIPLHWTRMIRRRFNQSGALAQALADELGTQVCVDGLKRRRATHVLDGKSREERFAEVKDAFCVNPKKAEVLLGRPVLLVDDVMTSGATLAGCTEACLAAGAKEVHVIMLARVAKRP